MIVYGKNGKMYEIIKEIGKGGEGSIHEIYNDSEHVIKIFSDKNRTETKYNKILSMINLSIPSYILEQFTWPIDVVSENYEFIGYVMPKVKNFKVLNDFYSGDSYHEYKLYDRIIIAKNICTAINYIHIQGQVCGDLNPKNIAVNPDSKRVTFMDTDSYHITSEKGRLYKCEVGLAHYLPREIQEKMKGGMNLSNAPLPTFSIYTDLFALAVHIFSLFMNGCHPFACAVDLSEVKSSVAAPQPVENIYNGYFPFSEKKYGLATPKYAPPFNELPEDIQNLFVRAFKDGHYDPSQRPTTIEWLNALRNWENSITKNSETNNTTDIDELLKNMMERNKKSNDTRKIERNNILLKETFWIVTFVLSLSIQVLYVFSDFGHVFGTKYINNWRYLFFNFAVWLGPWGFIIFGLIGLFIINTIIQNNNSYTLSDYFSSIIISICFSFCGWILLIRFLTFLTSSIWATITVFVVFIILRKLYTFYAKNRLYFFSKHQLNDIAYLKKEQIFWIATFLISLGIQENIDFLFEYVPPFYKMEYIDSWKYLFFNLAVWLGPWGYIFSRAIVLFICNIIYFFIINSYDYIQDISWLHSIISIMASIFFSALLWHAIIEFLTFTISSVFIAITVFVVFIILMILFDKFIKK